MMSHKDPLDRKPDIYYIGVLGKTLDILDVFTSLNKPKLSLQDISVATKLNKNTVFRILYTLAKHGYISKENHSYRLGQRLLDLGSTKLHRQDLLTVAGPYLDNLRDEFGETVNLGVLDGGCVRYVDVRESRKRFRFAERIGGSDPLHSTALGKAQLAFLPSEDVRRLMQEYGMRTYTEHTITTIKALIAELERIRADGYAVDRQESMLGAFCVAAPILDSNTSPVAAISIAGPDIRFGSSNLRVTSSSLLKAVAEIQKKLGY
ncbi:MAG: IclR family transcriptional regulator [Acidobacteriaceae bacterium]